MKFLFWLSGIPAVAAIKVATLLLKEPEDETPEYAPTPRVTQIWERKPITIKEWP